MQSLPQCSDILGRRIWVVVCFHWFCSGWEENKVKSLFKRKNSCFPSLTLFLLLILSLSPFPLFSRPVTHIAWILDFLHQHSVFPFFHLKVSLFLSFYFYSGNFPLLCHSAILCILNFHILFLSLWVFKRIIFKHVFYSSLRILIRLNSKLCLS